MSAELYSFLQSPLGMWRASWIEHRLSKLDLVGFYPGEKIAHSGTPSPAVVHFQDEWTAYWRGGPMEFRVPILLQGTVFQQRVWKELRKIPYGRCISYRDLSFRVGSPRAYRAVGSANSKNPLPIVVPCHRVIQANGGIGGFAFGNGMKKFLIEYESRASRMDLNEGS